MIARVRTFAAASRAPLGRGTDRGLDSVVTTPCDRREKVTTWIPGIQPQLRTSPGRRVFNPLLGALLLVSSFACGGPQDSAASTSVKSDVGSVARSTADSAGRDRRAGRDLTARSGSPVALKPAPAGAAATGPENRPAKRSDPATPSPARSTLDVERVLADPSVGVQRCDAYIDRYLKCIEEHVPDGEQATRRRALAEQVAAWKQMKSGAKSADAALEIGCRTAAEGAKATTREWNCRW
ncbi:MAG: hypothetical protein B7733_00995 [Myxococcales bacterium FL481]|nr:MAG: hypothetical protein B7733_00995 [Myxococcales bacterium FL481]